MAAVTDFFGTVALVAAPSHVTVTLDEKFTYQVRHTGIDDEGNPPDANSVKTAYLTEVAAITGVNMAEEDGKYALMAGQSVEIGPGIKAVYIWASSGADGILAFSRKDTSTRAW